MKTRKDKNIPRNDLTGKKFRLLTVIKFDSYVIQGKNNRVSYWECKCDCGNIKKVKGTHLTRGDTQSCGCYKPGKLKTGEASLNYLLKGYQRHAKNRNYEWFLTKEQFRTLTKGKCKYCNIAPQSLIGSARCNGKYQYNGVDRINNEPYYKLENTVSCCKLCNWMKRELSLEKFKEHIGKICKIINK